MVRWVVVFFVFPPGWLAFPASLAANILALAMRCGYQKHFPGLLQYCVIKDIITRMPDFVMPTSFPETKFREFALAARAFFPDLKTFAGWEEMLYDPQEKHRQFN